MAHREDNDRSIPWIARMLLDTGPAGVALLEGPEFTCSYVNASCQAIAPSRAMLGRNADQVWPEVASRLLPALRQARDTGQPLEATEWRLDLARNGATEPAWFTFRLHPLPVRPGEPASVAVHVLDRTGAVLARAREEELRAERERLLEVERTARAAEQLAQVIPQIVWTADASGAADWLNHHFGEYTGLDAGAARGSGWLGAVHPDDAPGAAARWAASVASGEPVRKKSPAPKSCHALARPSRVEKSPAEAEIEAPESSARRVHRLMTPPAEPPPASAAAGPRVISTRSRDVSGTSSSWSSSARPGSAS